MEITWIIIFHESLCSLQVFQDFLYHLISRQNWCRFFIVCSLVWNSCICWMLTINRTEKTQEIKIDESTQTQCFSLDTLIVMWGLQYISMGLNILQQIIQVCHYIIHFEIEIILLTQKLVGIIEYNSLVVHAICIITRIITVQTCQFIQITIFHVTRIKISSTQLQVSARKDILESRLRLKHLVGRDSVLW